MWRLILLGYCCFFAHVTYCYSQSTLHGKVIDVGGTGIGSASVILKNADKIIAFTSTDEQGTFSLSYRADHEVNKLLVEINHISYIQQTIALPRVGRLLVTLEQKQNILKEIRVGKSPAIRLNQDTIIYQVRQFVDSMNKSIGDVLQKMPGFHIAENGQISYNGQAISNFYLDGDDLLGKRYGLGTRVIPHDIVGTVEVFRNHQSILALKDKLNSNDVAINLTVKKNAKNKIIGEVKLGGGIPDYYHMDINNIFLNHNIKTLNTFTLTNTDQDVKVIVRDLISKESETGNYLLKTGFTTISDEPASNFEKNRSIGLSSNILLNTKNSWKVRLNGGLYIDRKLMNTNTIQKYLLADSSIANLEEGIIKFMPLEAHFVTNFTKNTPQRYMSNELALIWNNNRTVDQLTSTSLDINEQLQHNFYHLHNNFQFIPNTTRSNIWNIRWLNSYSATPERQFYWSNNPLAVLEPFGLFSRVTQQVKKQDFSSYIIADLSVPNWRSLQHTYGIEGGGNISKFVSDLSPINPDYSLMFLNNNRLSNTKLSLYSQLQWNYKKLRSGLRIPIGFQHNRFRDDKNDKTSNRAFLLFTPSIDIRYILSAKQHVKLLVSREQALGKIEDIFSGLVLSDFRTLGSGIGIIPYTINNNYIVGYGLEFIERMLFLNFQYTHRNSKQNLIHNLTVEENNTRSVFVEENNHRIKNEFKFTLSKFIPILKGTSSILFSTDMNESERIINKVYVPSQVKNINLSPRVEGKIGLSISWSYQGGFNWMKGKTFGEFIEDQDTQLQSHRLLLTYRLSKGLFWSVQGTTFDLSNKTTRMNLNFLNTTMRFLSRKKTTIEYELAVNNILNQKESSSLMIAPNMTFSKNYALRGRWIMFNIAVPLDAIKL